MRTRDPGAILDDLRALLAAPRRGLARHTAYATALVEAGELAQGLADAALTRRGIDGRDPASDTAMALLVTIARAIDRSWTTEFADQPHIVIPIFGLLPEEIECRRAEGFAFHAVYPECYLAAARRAPPGPRRVLGLRSIGAPLAAMVAAATGAPLPATVRPRGDPSRRELAVAPELADELGPGTTVAIVDEGPGRSGSSFGAAIALVERRGARVEVFPSHANDLGAAANEALRARWRRVPRHVVLADDVILPRLAEWISDIVGPLVAPLVDLSAGAWRAYRIAREADWPPAVVPQERRKLLAHTDHGAYLARFVGLGHTGEHAFERARILHRAGFTPEPIGLCHGFLVERWHGDARVLDPAAIDPAYLLARVGDYLMFRARAFPQVAETSLGELTAMARYNLGRVFGDDAGWVVPDPPTDGWRRPIAIDGRLHAWEWLVTPAGGLVKTDALDHHAGHDLIGCQDVSWDVAGAVVELGLPADRLATRVGASPSMVEHARICYLAFQLGRATLALESAPPTEAGRLQREALRYATLVREGVTRTGSRLR